MLVLGIDGGGTKTTGVIANANGEVLKEVTVDGSNLNSTNKSEVEKEITKLITLFKTDNIKVFSQITRVFAGMSGVGHPATKKEMQRIITSLFPETVNITIDHDAIPALYSGTLGRPGIVQIAGTGAITFGINKNLERGRVGGWGHLFGDYGSGYAIGRDGLSAAFMAYDGLQNDTYLNELFVKHFQVKSLPEIIQMIYRGRNPKELIASLSKLVVEATDHGDHTAKEIIRKNGSQLGESISSLIKRLFPQELNIETIPVVLAGGLFNRFDLFENSIKKAIEDNSIEAEIIIPKILPVGGAIIAALQEEKQEINNDFPDLFRKYIT